MQRFSQFLLDVWREACRHIEIVAVQTGSPQSFPDGRARPASNAGASVKTHIERALIETNGQVEGKHGAGAVLDINPHTLRARMRKLGIEWTRFRSK